mmetsp:Transcript_1567/g.2417  ORF Transcript_1567/g.2417 Transcript_1567/m.2417 type:complete len:1653 (-) Transcript_1567:77-5035(-)
MTTKDTVDMSGAGIAGENAARRTAHPTAGRQMQVLVKKQLGVEKKNWVLALLRTFLGPVLLALYSTGYAAGYSSRANKNADQIVTYSPQSVASVLPDSMMAIAPNATTDRVWIGGASGVNMTGFYDSMKSTKLVSSTDLKLVNYSNADEMQTALTNAPLGTILGGVYVTSSSPTWTYDVYVGGINAPNDDVLEGKSSSYIGSGFTGLQILTEATILFSAGVTSPDYQSLLALPSRNPNSLSVGWSDLWLAGFYIAVGLMFTVGFYLAKMVAEQRKEIVRALVLMGVPKYVYWFHWVITYSLFAIFAAGLYTVLFIVLKFAPQGNAFLIYVNFFLLLVGIASWSIMIPIFVKKDEVAAVLPFLFWLLASGVYVPVLLNGLPSVALMTVLTVINPWWGAFQFCAIYVQYDWKGYNVGVSWGNAWESGIIWCIIGQLLSIMLYLALAYFHFLQRRSKDQVDPADERSTEELSDKFEPLASNADVVLDVQGLRKTFQVGGGLGGAKTTVKAVNGLNMQILKNEVYGFLGHNGAGKTTAISLLSGELLPDAGVAEFSFTEAKVEIGKGQDDYIRTRIGVCPQHDMLFEELTCREHLKLFAKLKGGVLVGPGETEEDAIDAEVERRLAQIKFTTPGDEDKAVGTYSGGMKRKASIAISMLGDPELVFLDEPTAGMDPFNRRIVWEMIQEAKVGKSIILTTHFMDEADILSDRIGILNHGKLVASGSSLFLKHKFGAGYELKFCCKGASDSQGIQKDIKKAAPQAVHVLEREENGSFEVYYSLPFGTEASFPSLLKMLDKSGCKDVSVNLTTLEQVFLKTGAEEAEVEDDAEEGGEAVKGDDVVLEETAESVVKGVWQDSRPQGIDRNASVMTKLRAVAYVISLQKMRAVTAVIFLILFPMLYIIAGFVVGKVVKQQGYVTPDSFSISPSVLGTAGVSPAVMFGYTSIPNALPFIEFSPAMPNVADVSTYFDKNYVGGLLTNQTLQYNSSIAPGISLAISAATNHSLTLVGIQAGVSSVRLVPLPYYDPPSFDILQLLMPMFLNLGFMVLAYVLIDIVYLKEYNLITVLRVMGVTRPVIYFGVALSKIVLVFLPFFVLSIVLAFALKNPLVGTGGRWLAFILTMVFYAYAVIPWGMMFVPMFKTMEAAKNWFPFIWMMFTMIPFILYYILLEVGDRSTAQLVGDILTILPPMAFQRALQTNLAFSTFFGYDDPRLTWSMIWSWESRVWYCILMMFVTGTLAWFVVFMQSFREQNKKAEQDAEALMPTDPDVLKEREYSFASGDGANAKDLVKSFKVLPTSAYYKFWRFFDMVYWLRRLFGNDPLRKYYGKKEACKGISIGVKTNELYVLLGPNGAGKSTTMKMMTGELLPDNGEVVLANRSSNEYKGFDALFRDGTCGYCPQTNSLFDSVSVKEHFEFSALVRGMDLKDPLTQVHLNSVATRLGLLQHYKKKSSSLSGGYKRKLCLSMAIIGYPDVVFMDEPSSGIDVANREKIWQTLKPMVANRDYNLPAMMLSTHDMDEAQQLATRAGIMIDGEMITNGSVARLSEKHCDKNFVEITFDKSAPESSNEDTLEMFRKEGYEPTIYEALIGRVKIQLPRIAGESNTLTLANIFTLLDKKQEEMHIEYYAVAQMSLEQIFIDLSREKFEGEKNEDGTIVK